MKLGRKTIDSIVERTSQTFDKMVEIGVLEPELKDKLMEVVKKTMELKDTHDIGLAAIAVITSVDLIEFRSIMDTLREVHENMIMQQSIAYLEDQETEIF